jgi:hypothetical protein
MRWQLMTVHIGIHHGRQIISLNMLEINRRTRFAQICLKIIMEIWIQPCHKNIKCQLGLTYSYQNIGAWWLPSDPCSNLKLTKCHLSRILDMTVASSRVRCRPCDFKWILLQGNAWKWGWCVFTVVITNTKDDDKRYWISVHVDTLIRRIQSLTLMELKHSTHLTAHVFFLPDYEVLPVKVFVSFFSLLS